MDQETDNNTHNPLHVMQAGEELICEIKRHPIGLLGIYGMVIFILIVIGVLVFGLAPSIAPEGSRHQVMVIGTLVLFVFAIIGAVVAFVNHIIYWGNRWFVTTDSVTQVQQTALFNKQSSQLSLENLEDVTAEKNGLLANMFNYGVLKCETAGERSKFMFLYCPNPTRYAQYILNARERFLQDIRNKESGRLEQPVPQPAAETPAQNPPTYS